MVKSIKFILWEITNGMQKAPRAIYDEFMGNYLFEAWRDMQTEEHAKIKKDKMAFAEKRRREAHKIGDIIRQNKANEKRKRALEKQQKKDEVTGKNLHSLDVKPKRRLGNSLASTYLKPSLKYPTGNLNDFMKFVVYINRDLQPWKEKSLGYYVSPFVVGNEFEENPEKHYTLSDLIQCKDLVPDDTKFIFSSYRNGTKISKSIEQLITMMEVDSSIGGGLSFRGMEAVEVKAHPLTSHYSEYKHLTETKNINDVYSLKKVLIPPVEQYTEIVSERPPSPPTRRVIGSDDRRKNRKN